jgi:hypothetical protein
VRTFLSCLSDDEGHEAHEDEIWDGQEEFVAAMKQHPRLFALKAGKLGFTELECAFDGWVALFRQPNARVHVFSRGDLAAQEVLGYIRFGLTHLPLFIRPRLLARPTDAEQAGRKSRGDTLHQLQFEGQAAVDDLRTVVSYPASRDVSIDQTATHAHVDELARMPFPEKTWQAVHSTIAPGGSCHIVTRGAGEDNYAAVLWKTVEAGASELHPFFQPYTARPGRDAKWYDVQAGSMTTQGVKQFAPETAEDALAGDAQSEFIPITLWDLCQEDLPSFAPDKAGLAGDRTSVVLSADAAVSGDCFGIVAVTRHPQRHTDVAVRAVRVWVPPKGGQIDFAEPEAFLREICKLYNVVQIAYDPYQLESMMQGLRRDGVAWCETFNQGKDRMIADSELRDLIVNRRIAHDGNRTLREHVENAAAQLDTKQDSKLRIVKKAPHRKVDLTVAMSMGCYRCLYLLL